MAATSDRAFARRHGRVSRHPIAAGVVVYTGTIVAIRSDGFAVPASDTAGLKVIGYAAETVSNSVGSSGDRYVLVERGALSVDNSATYPVTPDCVGYYVDVEDDSTVAARSTNHIIAGLVVEIDATDSDRIWVEFYPGN